MGRPKLEKLLDRALFAVWPYAAFILPALICWGFGDIEHYFLIALSWVIIPVTGLLALIPFAVARSRGWRTVPGNSIALLVLHWWSWLTVALALPGKLTGGGGPSVLELLSFVSISGSWTERIIITAVIVGGASWAALIVSTVAAGSAPGAGAARMPSRIQLRIGVATAIGAPCLTLIAAMLGGVVENTSSDAAGERPDVAAARPIDAQLDLLAQREDATQAALGDVRKLIAADGWSDAHTWMFSSCEREANPCYDIYAIAKLAEPGDSAPGSVQLNKELTDAGWKTIKRPQYCHGSDLYLDAYQNDAGQRLCVDYSNDAISVAMIAPSYWGDLFDLRDAAQPDAMIFTPGGGGGEATYAWNEWPVSDLSPR